MRVSIFLLIFAALGCTTESTRLAIRNYEDSGQYQRLAFSNTYRIAEEQMALNVRQFIKANPDKAQQAVTGATKARRELEECRVQYNTADALSRLTVGQYLYDRQGAANVIIESLGKNLGKTANAAGAAKDASGVRLKDLIPKVDTTTQPASGAGDLGTLLDEGLRTLSK